MVRVTIYHRTVADPGTQKRGGALMGHFNGFCAEIYIEREGRAPPRPL